LSVTGVSHIEIVFAIGAVVMTIIVGLVMLPAIRKALREDEEDRSKSKPE
jgi:hypothetical protein